MYMKKNIISLAILLICGLSLMAQNFSAEMVRAERENDTVRQAQILAQWEKQNPNDPALYYYYFDYYYSLAWNSDEILTTEKPVNKRYYEVPDSTGKVVAYLTQGDVNKDYLAKAMEKIDKGINMFPNYLDLRLDKLYALCVDLKDWDKAEAEILKAVEYSTIINNKWYPQSMEVNEEMFLSYIVSFENMIFSCVGSELYSEKESEQLALRTRKIAESVLGYYPKSVDNVNIIGATYFALKDYDKALETFKKAEAMSPENAVVLLNMAVAYEEKGDKDNAIKCCNKLIDNPNTRKSSRLSAEQILKRLTK